MARVSFKPDASFYKKIAIGAVGARAVAANLRDHGHDIRELENGSTDTKLWKEVKRKRVRIPDLVCIRCGLRIESRAKTNRELSMSHSPTHAERAWDYGMVDSDVVAFPVCGTAASDDWSVGRLAADQSYWHSKERIRWFTQPHINYFTIGAFRAVTHSREQTKGATEGSETSITWDAVISTRTGLVEAVDGGRIAVRRESDNHLYSWNSKGMPIRVSQGQRILQNQVLASAVEPVSEEEIRCPGEMCGDHIANLLISPERSQRFTGVKLARLRGDSNFKEQIERIVQHPDEDLYVKLEGVAYLSSVCGGSARRLFGPYLNNPDKPTQLECVVALSEVGTVEAVSLLSEILHDVDIQYFLRSAAAWALGRIGTPNAVEHLIRAFGDVESRVREEALDAVSNASDPALDLLVAHVIDGDEAIAAGSAEAIRRQSTLPREAIQRLVDAVNARPNSEWPIWLLGQLPREVTASAVADLQDQHPEAHFAIAVLWSFVNSWIAPHWELCP